MRDENARFAAGVKKLVAGGVLPDFYIDCQQIGTEFPGVHYTCIFKRKLHTFNIIAEEINPATCLTFRLNFVISIQAFIFFYNKVKFKTPG